MDAYSLTLQLRSGPVRLGLARDPGKERRAIAHGLGCALWHVDPLEGPARDAVLALAEAWRKLGAGPAERPLEALAEVLSRIDPEARLVMDGADQAAQPMPRWPAALRVGGAAPEALWPFDPE